MPVAPYTDNYKIRHTEETSMDILGVETDSAPAAALFPQRFNPSARYIWEEMFCDLDFQLALRDERSITDKWFYSIQVYLKRCAEHGVPAFNASKINLNNDLVVAHLTRTRIKLAAFYKRTGFFRHGEIGRLTREYRFRNGTLTITVSGFLRPQTIDPTFESFLLQLPAPRFKRATGVPGLYVKQNLAPNLELFVRFYNRQRIEVGYSIYCQRAPFMAHTKRTAPDKATQTRWVDEEIWLPIVRAHRIPDVRSRLF